MDETIQWAIYLSAAVLVFGVTNTAYTLAGKAVTAARRPLYWYRLATKIMLTAIIVNYVIRDVFQVPGLPQGLTAIGTVMVLVLIGFDWAIEDYVDRAEYRQIVRLEARRLECEALLARYQDQYPEPDSE